MIKADGELSVRVDPVGGDVAPRVDERPEGWLDGAFHVTLLVHGFNNDQGQACEGFGKFLDMLPRVSGRVGRFFWPGDADFGFFQWLDFLSYPTEIPDARDSAERLATYLVSATERTPDIVFTLVGHSLGCRLILEMLENLGARPETERPTIRLIMLMAAAVPVELAEDGERLRRAGERAGDRLVLFSPDDLVLHFAFPAGQTLAFAMEHEDAVYLEAIGRFGNPPDFASDLPIRRSGNGHGSYWEDQQAAAILARKLGAAVANELAENHTPEHETPSPRALAARAPRARALAGGDWSVCADPDSAGPDPSADDMMMAE